MTQVANRSTAGPATQRYVYAFPDSGKEQSLLMFGARVPAVPQWKALLDQLREWRDAASAGEEIDPGAARRAFGYARLAAAEGTALPSRVGPTASGGISFEWERGNSLVHFEILDAWRAEYSEFSGTELVLDADLEWDEAGQEFSAVDS